MRLYTFTNMYLSAIQQGIQPLHVLGNLFAKYAPKFVDNTDVNPTYDSEKYDMLYDYALDHKTVICLNAGFSEGIHKLISDFMTDTANPYPWASFREGEDALDSALTSVGIVLPARIYDGAAIVRSLRPRRDDVAIKNWKANRTLEIFYDAGDDPFTEQYTNWEAAFMEELNKFGLAR